MKRHGIRWWTRYEAGPNGLREVVYCTVCEEPISYVAFRRRDGKLVSFPIHVEPPVLRGVPA